MEKIEVGGMVRLRTTGCCGEVTGIVVSFRAAVPPGYTEIEMHRTFALDLRDLLVEKLGPN